MRHRMAAVLTLGLLSALILGSGAVHAEEKKVVFVAGRGSHGYGAHEHHAGCLLLSDLLNKYHDGVTSEVFRNGWPDDPDAFDGADSIVIFSDGGRGHPALPHLDQLEATGSSPIPSTMNGTTTSGSARTWRASHLS